VGAAESGPPAAVGLSELRRVWGVDLIRRLAMLAFVGVGVFVALSTWLQTLLHHDRISSDAAGAMLVGMLVAGTVGCGVVPPAVARRSAERRYVTFVVVWVGAMFACLAAAHPLLAVDFVVIALIGFVLLAALPVLLEVAERRMGESGGVATGILLLAGNAGGLVLALIIGGLINVPTVAFLVLGVAALLGLHPARRLPLRFRED
jgi:fucose permease